MTARAWDIKLDDTLDLTREQTLSDLESDIGAGRVLAANLGTPCTSFSIARNRTRVIRTRRHPWGVPEKAATHP